MSDDSEQLKEIKLIITTLIDASSKEIKDEIERILFKRPPEWSENLRLWIQEQLNHHP